MAAQWGAGRRRGAGARLPRPRLWMRDGALEKKGCMSSAHRLNGRRAATQIEQQDGKPDTFLRSTTPGSPYLAALWNPAQCQATHCILLLWLWPLFVLLLWVIQAFIFFLQSGPESVWEWDKWIWSMNKLLSSRNSTFLWSQHRSR